MELIALVLFIAMIAAWFVLPGAVTLTTIEELEVAGSASTQPTI